MTIKVVTPDYDINTQYLVERPVSVIDGEETLTFDVVQRTPEEIEQYAKWIQHRKLVNKFEV